MAKRNDVEEKQNTDYADYQALTCRVVKSHTHLKAETKEDRQVSMRQAFGSVAQLVKGQALGGFA